MKIKKFFFVDNSYQLLNHYLSSKTNKEIVIYRMQKKGKVSVGADESTNTNFYEFLVATKIKKNPKIAHSKIIFDILL